MRMSQLFGQTLREPPADAQITSHQLLVQAGFIRQLGAGIFSYLHLARRSMTKIENILRDEMNAIGGQEITMPVFYRSAGRFGSLTTYGQDCALYRLNDPLVCGDRALRQGRCEICAIELFFAIQASGQSPQ